MSEPKIEAQENTVQQRPPEESAPKGPATLSSELWQSVILTQISECWNDIRQLDGVLWQIPAGIGAILGLILTALGPRSLTGRPGPFEVIAVFGAFLVTFSLVVALYKNRIFQVSRSIYIKSLYKELLRVHNSQPGQSTTISINAQDYAMSELPGLVAFATRDLAPLVQKSVASASGFVSISGWLRGLPAFKILFYVSVSVVLGELVLGIWLLIRLIQLW
jgi:hypothetical protein